MRTPYLEFAKKVFLNKMVYRFDYLIGILNTCLQIFIFWCIYKTLYKSATEINGVTFTMVTTNFILSLGLSNAFSMNDFFIQGKMNDGSIANELLKPVNFKLRMLAETLGTIFFQLLFNFLPACIIAVAVVGIKPPVNVIGFLLFIVSACFGFLVLWCINVIVQMSSFWFVNVWSISTIKNVFVNVMSGSMLPLWFMPEPVMKFIQFTPFDSIYFTPIRIYLGELEGSSILLFFTKQLLWIIILYLIGELLWRFGQKKLVVQGG